MLVSIVILTLNNWNLTERCLQSITNYTEIPYEIICVDNGSSDGTQAHLRDREDLYFIENERNLGFARACNQGMAAASGDYILLLNNDTVVSHRWLGNLMTVLTSSPEVGIVGPMSNLVIPQQRYPASYPTYEEYHRFAETFNRSNASIWRDTTAISGFCMLFHQQLYHQIGGLDESFLRGGYEDIDFCYRALKAGRRLVIASDTYVHHVGNASFLSNSIDMNSLAMNNRRVFLKKWGFNPDRLIYTLDENFLPGSYAASHPHHPSAEPTPPSGILVCNTRGEVYKVEQGNKQPIFSLEDFYAFGFRMEQVVHVTDDQLALLPVGETLINDGLIPGHYPDVFIARSTDDGMYLISHGLRYPFADYLSFKRLGYRTEEAVLLTAEQLAYFPLSVPIDANVLENHELIDYRLYMDPEQGQYYAEGGRLRPIPTIAELVKYKWHLQKPIPLPRLIFDRCPKGPNIV